MSGHSKWHNIQHKKGLVDAARSGLFTKLAREITMAAKLGDKNPDNNPRLRLAILQARKNSMPNDNIKRAIEKASGSNTDNFVAVRYEGYGPNAVPVIVEALTDNPRLRLAILQARKNSMPNDNIKRAIDKASGSNTDNYVAVRYEGYGPNAVPVIVEALTDNPRRTVPEVRNIFAKNGGNMGEEGSVVFMFSHVGQIMYPASIGKTEDEMMELVMEVDADNLESSEEGFIITTKTENFMSVQKALADKLGEPENAEITWVPNMPVDLDDEAYAKLEKLVDALDANDDVQKVFTAAA